MDQIFVVEGSVDYEGSSVLRAFYTQKSAEAFADLLRAHESEQPKIDSGEHTMEEWDAYDAALERWRDGFPAGRGGYDNYIVYPVPFVEG